MRAVAASAATDVHALGLMLHEGLTGERVWRGQELLELRREITTRVPGPPSASSPQPLPELDGLVRRALAKDPLGRPAAAEFAAELKVLLRGTRRRPSRPGPRLPSPRAARCSSRPAGWA